MYKKLFIRFILPFFIILISITSFARDSHSILTNKERDFLQNHGSVKIGFLENMPPFSFLYNGEHMGFSKEYFDLIVQKTSIKYHKVFGTWPELYNMFKKGDLDVIADISYRDYRTDFTLFTKPYYVTTVGVYTSDDFGIYNDVEDIADKKVGLVKEIFYEDVLKNNFPDMKVIEYKGTEEVLKGLSYGKVDAAVVNVNLGNFEVSFNKLKNIRLAGRLNYEGVEDEDVRFGIKKKLPELYSVFKKAMDNVSGEETALLLNRWINITPAKLDTMLPLEQYIISHDIAENKSPLRYCVNKEFKPLFFRVNGVNKGILIDLLGKISRNYGIRIQYVQPPNNMGCSELLTTGDVDFIPYPELNNSEDILMNTAFVSIPIAIVSRDSNILPVNIGTAVNKIAIIEEHPVESILRRNYSLSNTILTDNIDECIEKVEVNEADGCVATVPELSQAVQYRQPDEIDISDVLNETLDIKFTFSSGSENLKALFDAISLNLRENETKGIVESWSPSTYTSVIDYKLIFNISAIFVAIIGLLYLRSRYLKKMSQQSKKNMELLSDILNGISEPISMIDKDYNMVFANESFKYYCGDDYLPYKTKCYHYTGESNSVCPNCFAKKSIENGEFIVSEKHTKWKNGYEGDYEVRHYPIKDSKDNVAMVVQVMIDVSKKKELENLQLRNLQLESIAQLSGGIAHDFNNMLAAIFGYVEVAKIQAGQDKSIVNTLQKILDYTDNAKALTNKLLTFAKGGKPHKKYSDLLATLEKACLNAVNGTNIRYNIDSNMEDTGTIFDSEQIRQAFFEICKNAVEAMGKEGTIDITFSSELLQKNNQFGIQAGRYFRIAFRDKGGGIPTDIKGSVFAPYVTTKEMSNVKGQGLGLSIAYSIIRNHGGIITYDTDWQKWSEFVVFLPVKLNGDKMDNLTREETVRKGQQRQNSGMKFLVLDDDENIGKMFVDMIKALGHAAVFTSTPDNCINAFKASLDKNTGKTDFDFVFLDLTPADDKSGFDVCSELRKMDSSPVYVLISGYSEKDKAVNYKEYGFKFFLQKPFTLDNIKSIIS